MFFLCSPLKIGHSCHWPFDEVAAHFWPGRRKYILEVGWGGIEGRQMMEEAFPATRPILTLLNLQTSIHYRSFLCTPIELIQELQLKCLGLKPKSFGIGWRKAQNLYKICHTVLDSPTFHGIFPMNLYPTLLYPCLCVWNRLYTISLNEVSLYLVFFLLV